MLSLNCQLTDSRDWMAEERMSAIGGQSQTNRNRSNDNSGLYIVYLTHNGIYVLQQVTGVLSAVLSAVLLSIWCAGSACMSATGCQLTIHACVIHITLCILGYDCSLKSIYYHCVLSVCNSTPCSHMSHSHSPHSVLHLHLPLPWTGGSAFVGR